MEKNTDGNGKNALVAIVFLAILGWAYWQKDYLLSTTTSKQVAGASTVIEKQAAKEKVAIPSFDLQKKVQDITEEVTKLDVKEVASSSPQVQKVIKDMESLKDLPKSQAKQACINICNGL